MSEERTVNERLDSIEEICQSSHEMIREFVGAFGNEKTKTASERVNEQFLFRDSLKRARKFWRWFGNKKEFLWQKTLVITSFVLILVSCIISVFFSPLKLLVLNLGEIIWMGFAIASLVFACKTRLKYDVNDLAANSTATFKTDDLGMKFLRREKRPFTVFRIIGIVCAISKIVYLAIDPNQPSVLVIAMEMLFIVSTIVSAIAKSFMLNRYSIIWLEGHAITTGEKVTLLLPPTEKSLITEEDFKNKMPSLFE